MNIDVYCYDDIHNPRCGGGGALRELTVHRLIAERHPVRFNTGNFKGARNIDEHNFTCRHLGSDASYLISRITFAITATISSLFSKADIIAVPYSIYAPVITFLFRPKKTVVLFFHVTGKEVFKKYGIFGIAAWIAEKTVLAFGKNFLTLTDSMAQMLLSKRQGNRARAGYVGFDTGLLSDTPIDRNFILCFGRIDVRMKGLDILIPAFDKIAGKFPRLFLVIAGRGQETNIEWVRNRIKESPYHERIQCLVNIPESKRKELFHTTTFVCMPSRFEGWNIAAIEAAASSKATLGTRIQGLNDSIKENETGLLVPPEDVDALAEKMALLLSDPALRKKLGKNGYAWAQNFTWEKVAKIQEEFYLEVIKTRNK
jgi:glycosyltransferase involved in cell wall biosynthesis